MKRLVSRVLPSLLVAAIGCSGSSAPTLPIISSFTATPASLPDGGGDVTLAWQVTGATGLTIDPGVGSVTGMSSANVHVTDTTTFTLTATNSSGQAIASTTVAVAAHAAPPTIASFGAAPTMLPLGGGSVTLFWDVTGAQSLSVDQGVGDVSGMSSTTASLTDTTTFTLTATNANGSVTAQATVTVYMPTAAPVINAFVASPADLTQCGGSTLIWDVTDAQTLSIDQGVGDVTGKSSISAVAHQTTTYTLSATNGAGTTQAQATVTIPAPTSGPTISRFQANPSSLPAGGGTTTLSWDITGAESVSIDNGVGDVCGETSVQVKVTQSTQFKLTVTNGLGTAQAVVLVNVGP